MSDLTKEKVFWTRKMNLKLVKFMEYRPNIWNPKHPKYTSIRARDKTYAEFASRYGNAFTWLAVKDRWTNIRSTFANYLRKINISRAKGDGEVYKVNWHLWKACSFLLKINKKVHKDDVLASTCQNDLEEDTNFRDLSSDDNESYVANSKCDAIVEKLVTVFKGVQNDAFGLVNTKYGQVGRAVANKLSQLNSYEAAQITHKITEILLLYDENNYMNPNNLKSLSD